MRFKWLKRIRVLLAIVFLVFSTLIFLDFTNTLATVLVKPVVYLQFVPSIIKFINLLTITIWGFVIVVLITLLFGRVYCSTICPAGTLQDFFIFFRRKWTKRKTFKKQKPRNLLRTAILAVVIIVFVLGSPFLLNLLEPFSNFGKIMTNLFRPVVILINNGAARIMESFNNYAIQPVEIKNIDLFSVLFSFGFFAMLAIMSFVSGRWFCNRLCPVGTVLGYISKLSIFKISLDQELCYQCGACQRDCKAGCIDSKNKIVDFSRCIGCFNCLGSCSDDAVLFKPVVLKSKSKTRISEVNFSKRNFLITTSALSLGLIGSAFERTQLSETGQEEKKKQPVTPPGSLSIQHFTYACTACHLCISACPTQVLQPSLLDYGLIGMMQPKMDYKVSFCNYDCIICTEVCPNGAILPLTSEEKKEVQIGKARFIKDECIVHTEHNDCGACSEHCPTKAVDMVPYELGLGLVIPEVDQDICVGCGACEHVCPTDPKAIVVDSNEIHQKAILPEIEEEKEEDIDYKEEFPF